MNEDTAVRRARAITIELAALRAYAKRVAAEREGLLRGLTAAGWSERDLAAELGISQPAVHKIITKGHTA